MSDTPAKNEATRETVEFEHFGRTWSVPAKQRFSHMETYQALLAQALHPDAALARTYLPADQVVALREIDPDADELDKFTDKIAVALGFKDSGN